MFKIQIKKFTLSQAQTRSFFTSTESSFAISLVECVYTVLTEENRCNKDSPRSPSSLRRSNIVVDIVPILIDIHKNESVIVV